VCTVVYRVGFNWNTRYTLLAGYLGSCFREEPTQAGDGARNKVDSIGMDDSDPSWGQLGLYALQILLITGITLRKWIEDEALRGDCRQAWEQRCVPAMHCEDPSSVRQSKLGILHGQKLRQGISGVPKAQEVGVKGYDQRVARERSTPAQPIFVQSGK
jgi:hypothetical protein